MAHGLPAQTIEQFYHGDASILDRVGFDNLAEADARLGLTSQFEQRTMEHYRETCINGYCSRVDLLRPPAAVEEPPSAGIRLDQPLTGAAFCAV